MRAARVVVADPAWKFNDRLPGKTRGAAKNYRTQKHDGVLRYLKNHPEIKIADDAILFLWRVSAMGEEAYAVMRAWGFVPKSEIVWRKLTKNGKLYFGMGRYTRMCHEVCLIGRRGKAKVKSRSIRSMFDAPVGAHSEKPDEFYKLVKKLTKGPHVELFARKRRRGWIQFGNQLGKPIKSKRSRK